MITVNRAPPFATIQDEGRFGHLADGVPRSGYADAESGNFANGLVGNPPGTAVLEIAVGGGSFKFDTLTSIALAGAEVQAELDGAAITMGTAIEVAVDRELVITRIVRGRFVYLAVAGGIDVPIVLGSRSTYLPAMFGGHEGRRLRNGDTIRTGQASAAAVSTGETGLSRRHTDPIEVVRGPQWELFDADARARFFATEFRVGASDRAGYRLDGATFTHAGAAAMLSEPTCVGAVQIPGGGSPIALMHDGPTIGGYPKIVVIRASSLGAFAQRTLGDGVRFTL